MRLQTVPHFLINLVAYEEDEQSNNKGLLPRVPLKGAVRGTVAWQKEGMGDQGWKKMFHQWEAHAIPNIAELHCFNCLEPTDHVSPVDPEMNWN